MSAQAILRELREKSSPEKARELQRFFKTAPGEYAEGDIFLGITVPEIRKIAKEHDEIDMRELKSLLSSKFHEARFCALVILIDRFKRTEDQKERRKIYDFYILQLNKGFINNWDLVDVSAPTIGQVLLSEKNRQITLSQMAKSKQMWVRRTSILITFASLRIGETKDTLAIATLLLADQHDLIQKEIGRAHV